MFVNVFEIELFVNNDETESIVYSLRMHGNEDENENLRAR